MKSPLMSWFTRSPIRHRSNEIASSLVKHGLAWLAVQVGMGRLVPIQYGLLGYPTWEATTAQAEHVRQALEELGATFNKLGQAISTRPDVLPPEYIEQLSQLQDSAPSVPIGQIHRVIQDELGRKTETLFTEFDPQPLASASIGQVHTAVLPTGDRVIIKVQRPGVREQVDLDLQILKNFAEWAEVNTDFGREYHVTSLVEEFAYSLQNELDYQREAYNVERFRLNFEDDPKVYIPKVYWEYTTGKVLTLERIEGIKISDIAGLDAAGVDRRKLAENFARIMLRSVFEFSFFHADPHPGNYFVFPDGTISLVDFGMVGSVDEALQRSLLRIGLAISKQDSAMLTDEFFALGISGGHVRREVLKRDLDHLLNDYALRPVQELAAVQVTNEVMALARRHRLLLPSELVMLFRVIAMSESLGAILDPEFRFFVYAEPYLQKYFEEKYSASAVGKRIAQSIYEAAELGIDLPQRAARLLVELEHGHLTLNMRHEGLKEFTQQLQQMVNRLSVTILVTASIIVLGILLLDYRPPGWEVIAGWLFLIVFLVALGFGAWLVWNIWHSRK